MHVRPRLAIAVVAVVATTPLWLIASPAVAGAREIQHPAANVDPASLTNWIYDLDVAHGDEHLPAIQMNMARFDRMTPGEQMFVLFGIERAIRGLTPDVALIPELSADARVGAVHNEDPPLNQPSIGPLLDSIYAGFYGTPTDSIAAQSVFEWVYDDGCGPSTLGRNWDCGVKGSADPNGWGHRDAVLGVVNGFVGACASPNGEMDPIDGTAWTSTAATAIFGVTCPSETSHATLTWSHVVTYLRLPKYEAGPAQSPVSTTTTTTTTTTLPPTTTTSAGA